MIELREGVLDIEYDDYAIAFAPVNEDVIIIAEWFREDVNGDWTSVGFFRLNLSTGERTFIVLA